MVVFVVAQSKGGVGKTTLAINVASEIVRSGAKAAVIDADPQGSATLWAEPRRLAFPVRQDLVTHRNQLLWVRDVLKTDAEVIVIDLPAGFGMAFETAVLIADLLIVPCGPSSLDISGTEATIAKAYDVRRQDKGSAKLRMVTVPTRVDPAYEEASEIRGALADLGEPVAPPLAFDMAFVRSFTTGTSVASDVDDTQAALDVRELARFLRQQVQPRGTRHGI